MKKETSLKEARSLIALAIFSLAAYLLFAWLSHAAGFPLDDAWIHQTYARNLGWYGQWAFVLGQPSAGSTSPLWTFLLALGYLLHLDYFLWTQALNAILLAALASLTYKVSGQWWAGVLVAVEWHLVWVAASGMETILFCVLIMTAWWLVQIAGEDWWRYLGCGLILGLAVWTRPDGLTLLPFCALAAFLPIGAGSVRAKRIAFLLVGAILILIPYFWFNLALSGQLWPNTFFAKQAEYAILLQVPLLQRLTQIFTAPFIGSLALLLPGLALAAKQRWVQLAWAASFLLSYVLRLPVTYQHARYLIPVVPVLIAVGMIGLVQGISWRSSIAWQRILSRVWVLGLGFSALVFWLLGANALVADNRVINSEMVTTAQWVAGHVPAHTVVAAHDIGALGYFADVRLVDLAGLVSPEVIPALGNDDRLWQFVQQGEAAYLITYPGWCPAFTRIANLTPVYSTGPQCDPAAPNLHMTVYQVIR